MSAETLFEYAAERRDTALARIDAAEPGFVQAAQAFVLSYLHEHGPTDTETLTDKCKEAGILPETSDRAFGGVTGGLSRRKLIERRDVIQRRKGNMTFGNIVWAINSNNQ